MDEAIKQWYNNLESKDKQLQYEAYEMLMAETEKEVDWAYEVWDQLASELTHKDPHKRSRAAQFLSSLAISDPEKKIMAIFPALWEVTKDPKFVTARHSLQTIWRVGLAGEEQKRIVIEYVSNRFINSVEEKNYTLLRYDIIQGLRFLYDRLKDDTIRETALQLIQLEEEEKYRKKYSGLWKRT